MQISLPHRLRDAFQQRFGDKLGQRTTGIIVAVGLELLLVILLLTIGQSDDKPAAPIITVSTFDAGSEEPEQAAEEQVEEAPPETQQAERVDDAPTPEPLDTPPIPAANPAPVLTRPDLPAPALIPLSRDDLARADITPRAPAAPATPQRSYGPSNSGRSGPPDSQRVGTAPNGQPMYAARWFREPYHDELSGYLSTASGPGWGLIVCQTAPKYRVENCEIIEEYPRGSGIARSAKAAAWQFQVRPARVNGVSQVGSWVRIKIDYTDRPQ